MHDVVTRPTRHTRLGRLLAVVGVFALFAAGLFSAAPASTATVTTDVYVLHGLNLDGQTAATDGGTPVTVCNDLKTIVADFQFGDVIGPLALPSDVEINLQVYDGVVDCATIEATPIIFADVIPTGAAVALVATSPPGLELAPELAAFPLDTACTKAGQGVLVAAHAAAAPEVDVQVNGTSAGMLTYGESLAAPLVAATYSVAVLLGGTPIVGPADVPVTNANLTGVFVVGNQPTSETSPVVPLFLNVKLATCEVPAVPAAAAAAAAATPAAATFTG